MPFVKGKSGNPGGRPKGSKELRDLCREHTPDAIDDIVKMAKESDHDRVRLDAWREILNRAWGKAPQALTGEGGEGPIQGKWTVEIVRADNTDT